ncbi:hypothetical protein NPIL_417461 [Nephila pilipes]|uniref:Uncharacterized protein n=1 Tax=Nephila pilipes TaxID=299642 RepID=A0A8X6MS64_NEPPI|nr:hypothetical protein NPIL_417461 [Nephila pilipes]
MEKKIDVEVTACFSEPMLKVKATDASTSNVDVSAASSNSEQLKKETDYQSCSTKEKIIFLRSNYKGYSLGITLNKVSRRFLKTSKRMFTEEANENGTYLENDAILREEYEEFELIDYEDELIEYEDELIEYEDELIEYEDELTEDEEDYQSE